MAGRKKGGMCKKRKKGNNLKSFEFQISGRHKQIPLLKQDANHDISRASTVNSLDSSVVSR